jgi:hypothetical protein
MWQPVRRDRVPIVNGADTGFWEPMEEPLESVVATGLILPRWVGGPPEPRRRVVMQRWAPAPGLLFPEGRRGGSRPVVARTVV